MVTESVMGDVTVTPVVTTLVRGDVETAVLTVVGSGEEEAVVLALAVTVVVELAVEEVEVEPETVLPMEVSAAPARVAEPSGPVTS